MSGRKQANSKRTRSHAERVQTLGEKGFSLLEPDNFDEETKFLFGDNLRSEVKFLGDFQNQPSVEQDLAGFEEVDETEFEDSEIDSGFFSALQELPEKIRDILAVQSDGILKLVYMKQLYILVQRGCSFWICDQMHHFLLWCH